MPLSNKWDMTDNVYYTPPVINAAKVDSWIIEYAKTHTKKDCYLYNNRLFSGICNPTKKHKDQYTANWTYIKSLS